MVIHLFLLSLILAEAPPAPAADNPPRAAAVRLPDETVVLELRRARIAGQNGDRERQRHLLDGLLASHPADPTALAAALVFEREVNAASDAARSLRGRLFDVLSQPGHVVPTPLLQDVASDPQASPTDLEPLLSAITSDPGSGADRVARLRVRVAVLDRLDRRDERLSALNDLAAVDPDPRVAMRLLEGYRDAGRWEDVLHATARIDSAQAGIEVGWWRLDALSALSRQEEVLKEALTLLDRLRARSSPLVDVTGGRPPVILPVASPSPAVVPLPPYLAERFFPHVFALVDAGRRDLAERLATALDSASPGVESVKRLRVMLFGSPDDRFAYLDQSAGASIGSADPEKIRNEAYQRLLAKDYRTALDLYRRLETLDTTPSSMNSGDWFNYGLAAIESEAWADADKTMTYAMETGASRPRALAHRARARIMTGRISEGMTDAEAALAIDPNLKQACYAMYLGYQKLGAQAKADEWLKRSKSP